MHHGSSSVPLPRPQDAVVAMNHSLPPEAGVEEAPGAVPDAEAGTAEEAAFAFVAPSAAGFGLVAGGAEQDTMSDNARSVRFKVTPFEGKNHIAPLRFPPNSLILRGLDFRSKTLIIRGLYVRHRPLRRETVEGHRG